MIDADDLRYFLEVARTGRLVAAGRGLGVNHTTVGRRITALERALGNRLFDRVPTGWVLTDAGHELVVHAESIESALLAAMEGAASGGGRLSGTVRIATPDGFGAFVLAPHLDALYSQHPDLDIEIVTATRHDVLAAREFDVAVTLERPSPRAVDISELADYRLGLYASADYLDTHPRIAHVLDLHEHALIGYVDSLLDVPALRILDEVLPGHRTRIQTNNITGQWTATAAGLGVSALPLYIGDPDPRLVRILDEEVTVLRKYWLIVPRELQRLARVRAAISALRSIAAAHEGLVTRTG
ncbi:LysR family transcriptional regulator [Rhodococcus sp. USK10]|uniref:LysR family transcriptional regulator n=1 Tax=Rhodococcus sp. USK10 TaxID=2789739 RepID=UPI001C5CE899|nr:LysR family transcriptional regulator [Rhodococcus sp. USK10]QYB00811.1 LysR family transcriptional regulator [Rhodococcus sp. USK10]